MDLPWSTPPNKRRPFLLFVFVMVDALGSGICAFRNAEFVASYSLITRCFSLRGITPSVQQSPFFSSRGTPSDVFFGLFRTSLISDHRGVSQILGCLQPFPLRIGCVLSLSCISSPSCDSLASQTCPPPLPLRLSCLSRGAFTPQDSHPSLSLSAVRSFFPFSPPIVNFFYAPRVTV